MTAMPIKDTEQVATVLPAKLAHLYEELVLVFSFEGTKANVLQASSLQ